MPNSLSHPSLSLVHYVFSRERASSSRAEREKNARRASRVTNAKGRRSHKSFDLRVFRRCALLANGERKFRFRFPRARARTRARPPKCENSSGSDTADNVIIRDRNTAIGPKAVYRRTCDRCDRRFAGSVYVPSSTISARGMNVRAVLPAIGVPLGSPRKTFCLPATKKVIHFI